MGFFPDLVGTANASVGGFREEGVGSVVHNVEAGRLDAGDTLFGCHTGDDNGSPHPLDLEVVAGNGNGGEDEDAFRFEPVVNDLKRFVNFGLGDSCDHAEVDGDGIESAGLRAEVAVVDLLKLGLGNTLASGFQHFSGDVNAGDVVARCSKDRADGSPCAAANVKDFRMLASQLGDKPFQGFGLRGCSFKGLFIRWPN